MSQLPIYIEERDEKLYNTLLNQYLQSNISQNGLVSPTNTTADITTLSSSMPDGTLWYDNDTNELKVRISGTVRVVQLV